MECQSQIEANTPITAIDFKLAIKKRDIAWFSNKHPISTDEECIEAFDNMAG